MIVGPRCPACGEGALRRDLVTPHVSVAACERCGHRAARHEGVASARGVDYHRQYGAGAFVESLATTRRRQAVAILRRIRAALPDADGILDFGAGRGWFLREAHAAGLRRLAGADTSNDAVAELRGVGVEGVAIDPPGEGPWRPDLGGISFRPRVLTLLDVVEHFPPDQLAAMFAAIVDQLRPELQLVVVKVPVADGLLYRTARLLARARAFAPIEQLYQVGTYPPHESYFTRRSLAAFLARGSLRVVDETGLLEFDPASFGARVAMLRRAPRAATRALGTLAAGIAERTWQDSWLVLARPRAPIDRP